MILGAGPFQVAAIRRAVAQGLRVITVDHTPANPGHRHSHLSVDVSTRDVEAVLEAAKAHRIDGIFTMASDVALPAVAHVAAALGLPGPDPAAVEVTTQKNRFRSFQHRSGIPAPAFIEVDSLEQAARAWAGGPAMVKPAANSGSRGVVRLDTLDEAARPAFEQARRLSYNDRICLEEYVAGFDVTAEGFVEDGVVRHCFVTRKHVEGFAVIGHELPFRLAPSPMAAIRGQVQSVFDALGPMTGPFDADLRVDEERVVLLEIAPRLGGNGVPVLVEAATGVPLIDLAIRNAMGEDLPDVSPAPAKPRHAAVLLRSPCPGRVRSRATDEAMRVRLPGITDLCLHLDVGDRVERFEHGGHVFGYCVLEVGDDADYPAAATRVHAALEMVL